MKRIAHILTILSLCLTLASVGVDGYAQQTKKEAREAQRALDKARKMAEKDKKRSAKSEDGQPLTKSGRALMPYIIEGGDTIFYDAIPPSWVFAKGMKKSDWKKYYRLVYNFNKVYPYCEMAGRIVHEADSTIEAAGFSRIQKEKYINGWQNRLLKDFEPVIRSMTISQGQLLVRLVDREIGKSTYDIIKDYKNGLAAGFWQGAAKLFKQDLKTHYDPDGVDAQTEELIQKWEEGEFEYLYYSIFGEMPVRTEIPSKYR